MSLEEVFKTIRVVKNYPKEGIVFRHIGPLLENTKLFKYAIKHLYQKQECQCDAVCGLDARGFIIATAIQYQTDIPQVMIRKSSKLPGKVFTSKYQKEYGFDSLELEENSIKPGQRVIIVDDLIATGGTIMAAIDLVIQAGGIVSSVMTLIEFKDLGARKRIQEKYPYINVHSLFNINSFDESVILPEKDSVVLTEKDSVILPEKDSVVLTEKDSVVLTKKHTNIKLFRPPVYHNDDKLPVLMWHPTMETFATKLLQVSNIRPSYINWEYFPDNWPNITFEPSKTLVNKDVYFVMSLSTKETFAEQLALLVALPRQLINSLTIVIPYLGPATHERVDYSGQLATVEPILKIISSCIPMTKTGPPIIRIFDIHALQIRFYTNDNVTMKLMSAIPVLLNYIKTKQERYVIAYPDDGSYKRFKYFFDDFPQVICSKIRDGDDRKIMIRDRVNWPDDKYAENILDNIIIVDDLVQSGETLLRCAEALKTFGFKNISAYVTHAVFPNNTWKKFTTSSVIHEFIVTNTNPLVTDKLMNVEPFTVLDITNYLCSELIINNPDIAVESKQLVNIYVASTNIDKLMAVYEVYQCAECIYNIYSVDVKSGVSNQPYTMTETRDGAINRLTNCMLYINNSDSIYIAIENGIYRDLGYYYDMPVVVRKVFDGPVEIIERASSIVSIPEKYYNFVRESLESGKTKTFGSIIEGKLGIKDWHKFVSGSSRKDLIKCTLLK